jgi:hypothetical protein
VLFALLAFAVIATAMVLNAHLQGRRARSLAGQRAALLSDVGVLQAALLPAVPGNLGELDVTVAYRPAQGLAAGGDFLDVFSLSSERTVIIGDVSGHGRESLIQAALVRYTLRTLMGEETHMRGQCSAVTRERSSLGRGWECSRVGWCVASGEALTRMTLPGHPRHSSRTDRGST